MPKPRKVQISLDATPYYHCVSRSMRRAFLCGEDAFTGKSFEHRRKWIRNKLFELAGIFSIDLCGYAVMSNHLHVLLFIDQETAQEWEPHEVVNDGIDYSTAHYFHNVLLLVPHCLVLNNKYSMSRSPAGDSN